MGGMTNTNPSNNHELSHKIEQLVQEHLESSRRQATEALERAFGTELVAGKVQRAERTRSLGKRRGKKEVAALGERFYEAVCEKPGESMKVLAEVLVAAPRELHRPVTLLKEAGRIRTVGKRQFMRYFPMVAEARASA